jgi:cell volume regulation protein A
MNSSGMPHCPPVSECQMGIGALSGIACGRLAVRLINRIRLDAPGLYPVLAGAAGLAAFGVAANTGGRGFLALYIAGIVLGNRRMRSG